MDEKLQLIVYPNPTKNSLNISCNTNSISSIVVTDLLGRIVPCEWTKTYSTLKQSYYQLQTIFILPGNYFIKIITTTGNTINSKFVKE
jgi:hypothetical protein